MSQAAHQHSEKSSRTVEICTLRTSCWQRFEKSTRSCGPHARSTKVTVVCQTGRCSEPLNGVHGHAKRCVAQVAGVDPRMFRAVAQTCSDALHPLLFNTEIQYVLVRRVVARVRSHTASRTACESWPFDGRCPVWALYSPRRLPYCRVAAQMLARARCSPARSDRRCPPPCADSTAARTARTDPCCAPVATGSAFEKQKC